jgi:hypothetical protein
MEPLLAPHWCEQGKDAPILSMNSSMMAELISVKRFASVDMAKFQ